MWWSWILTFIGVTAMYLAGRKKTLGWMLGLVAQTFWLAYAITTKQWGFVLSAFAYGTVYGRNWHKWHKENDETTATNAKR